MADEIQVEPITDAEELAKKNAETIQKQKDQDISGQPTGGSDNLDGRSSLDALREKAIKAQESPDPAPDPDPDPAPAPVVEDPEKKKADEEAAAKKKAEDDALTTRAQEIFKDAPALAPNASPKSSEAFHSVKLTAAREISQLEAAKSELEKQLHEAQEKLKSPLPPEIEKELKELREFRVKLDVDADPKFKEFDKQAEVASEFIYAQLKKSPAITDEIIAEIKKFGGPENVDMEKILDAVKDPLIRRLVEAKQADLALISHNKAKAIEENKSNVTQYMADREKQWQETATAHNSATRKNIEGLASRIDWMNQKPIDAKADADTKKAIEAHNAYAANARKELELAMTDDSPEMRATLLIGMVNLFRLQSAHDAEKAEHAKSKAALKTAEETVARLKGASVSRLRDSSAPISPREEVKKGPDYTESASSALDRIRQQKAQQQQS